MNDQKNLIFFVMIFLGVMVGWHFFYEAPKAPQPIAAQTQQQPVTGPALPLTAAKPVILERKAVLTASTRVQIETPSLKGSINLKGGAIDDLTLEKYRETTDKNSSHIVLLTPEGAENPYFVEFGWTTADKTITLPDGNTIWIADRESLNQTSGPVTLSWVNPQGIRFERLISVDENYMFTVEQTVTNTTSQPIKLVPYSQVNRVGTPPVQGYMILHEGPLGYIADKLKEYNYTDLQGKEAVRTISTGGWAGITDKYWLTALIPDQKTPSEFYFQDNHQGTQDVYHTGYMGEPLTIAPGQKSVVKTNLFAGAKVLSLLDGYEEKLGVKHFDLAVDFGWFYFITKPLFYLLNMIYGLVGNFGIAILLLTILIKAAFFPLANKSYRSMARMKDLQPKMEKIKERYADDRMKMNQEMMDLYKREKVNPASGCLPILIQIPVFFALYKVLFVTIEMRQAPFYGWIHDLSMPDPTTIFNLFGIIPWTPPALLMIGALPIMMGASMWVQQKLNPAPMDPIQQKMFMIMPVMLTYLLAQFPAGLVLYWTWHNILSIIQQWLIMTRAKKTTKAKA
jgi:YidC/Oxa1 family membrane protein insertase